MPIPEFVYGEYSQGTPEEYAVHVWCIHTGLYEIELLQSDTGETLKSGTFEGLEEDAIEESRQWLKTI